MSDAAIRVTNVWKQYRLGETGYRSLREDIVNVFKRRRTTAESFWALQDASFAVADGEAVGIIGPNGAGKTTVLRLLAGITKPSAGTVETRGGVGALIDLTAGLHPELTGRENVYLYGAIIGMRRGEVEKRYSEIVEYAGLEHFIDTPVKRYSAGMCARLGFAVAAHLDPDILLVDEVLAVGDYTFQAKCLARMDGYRKAGKSIVYVSHNLESVRKLCTRAILLHQGRIVYDGDVDEAIRQYYLGGGDGRQGGASRGPVVELVRKSLVDLAGRPCTCVNSGARVVVELTFRNTHDAREVDFALVVKHASGLVVYDTSSALLNVQHFTWPKHRDVALRYELSLHLLKGTYSVGCNISGSRGDGTAAYLFYDNNLLTFAVQEQVAHQGVANLEAACAVRLLE